MSAESYKPLGLIAIVILWFGLGFLVARWPKGLHATFSQHAAASRITELYYVGLFAITLPMLMAFFVGWFAPVFRLSSIFLVLIWGSVLAQFVVTLIPETGGWKTQWHRVLSFGSAGLLVPALAMVTAASRVSVGARLASCVCLLAMLEIIAVMVLSKAQHR